MKSIAFVRFLDAKDRPSGKTYTYIIDDSMYKRLTPGVSNKVGVYHIANNSGYNYRGAKVVCIANAVIADEQAYDFSELKQIITAEYCGDVTYTRSERNQDEYEARKNFDKTYKKATAKAVVSNIPKDNTKVCIKQSDAWQELFKPYEMSFTTDNETLNNSLWKILNTPTTTTEKISDIGLISNKLVSDATSSTVTNVGTIKCDPNTVVGTITSNPWSTTGSITINSTDMETNYLKINNMPKVNIEEKKEKKSMFKGMLNNLRFGKADNAKMSIYGPALREAISGDTWVAFNKSKEQWIDVPYEAILDIPLFEMPVAKSDIQIGDFIFHAGIGTGWVRVIDFDDKVNYFIEAEDPSNHEIIKILPTRNMFGFDFYTKLIVPFDMGSTFGGASASNPFGMLPMLMMMNDKDKSEDSSMLMAMMMMQNGGMDFTSNPMMLYTLMGDKGRDNSMLMAMLMSQTMQGAPTKCVCNCDHE